MLTRNDGLELGRIRFRDHGVERPDQQIEIEVPEEGERVSIRHLGAGALRGSRRLDDSVHRRRQTAVEEAREQVADLGKVLAVSRFASHHRTDTLPPPLWHLRE